MSKHQLLNGEVFLEGDYLALCVNASGSLGGAVNAPAGFTTDAKGGFLRVGLLSKFPKLVKELVLPGTPLQGPVYGFHAGGKVVVKDNCARDSHSDIAGAVTDVSTADRLSATWQGQTAEGLVVTRRFSFAPGDKAIRVDQTLANISDAPLTQVHAVEILDPDPDASFNTTNSTPRLGTVVGLPPAKTAQIATLLDAHADPRAIASAMAGYDPPDPYAAHLFALVDKQPSGDTILVLAWDLGDLAPGAANTQTFFIGVTDELSATLAAIDGASGTVTPPAAPVQPTPPPTPTPTPTPTPPPPPPSDLVGDVALATAWADNNHDGIVAVSSATAAKLKIKAGNYKLLGQNKAGQYVYVKV